MINLTEFRGIVDIAGKTAEVMFTEGILTVTGLTCSEAQALLGATPASRSFAEAVKAHDTPAKTGPKPKANGAAVTASKTPPTPASTATETKPEPVAKVESKPALAVAEKPVEPKPTVTTVEPKKGLTVTVVASAKVEPELEPEAEPEVIETAVTVVTDDLGEDDPWGLSGGALPTELIQAKRMRDIVVFLQERGHHTEAAIAERCEKIKDQVPVLSRIPDIADRVKRTLEVMGYEG